MTWCNESTTAAAGTGIAAASRQASAGMLIGYKFKCAFKARVINLLLVKARVINLLLVWTV